MITFANMNPPRPRVSTSFTSTSHPACLFMTPSATAQTMGSHTDVTLVVEGTVERWRLKCPVEHQGTNVVPRDDHWHCRTCKRTGIDPAYAFVRDTKTGRLLAPDEVEIRETQLKSTVQATDD